MFLKFKPFEGPSDYEFKDPDTGFEFKARTRAELVKLILAYRINNDLPDIEELDTVIDTYLCTLPLNQHKCKPTELKRGFLGYLKGGIALIQQLLYRSYVDQAEADRRAEICIKCPHNFFPDKGPFIAWSDNIAKESVGERKSAHYNELGNCAVCTCCLRAKVWYGGKIDLTPTELVQMQKVNCWQPEFSK